MSEHKSRKPSSVYTYAFRKLRVLKCCNLLTTIILFSRHCLQTTALEGMATIVDPKDSTANTFCGRYHLCSTRGSFSLWKRYCKYIWFSYNSPWCKHVDTNAAVPPHQVNEIIIDYTQCIAQTPGQPKMLGDDEFSYTFTSANTTGMLRSWQVLVFSHS